MTTTELQDMLARTIQSIAATTDEKLKADLLELAALVVARLRAEVAPS